jgi:hypothetical protein
VSFEDFRARMVARLARPDAIATHLAASSNEPILGLFATPLAAIDSLLGLKVARAHFHGRGADALLRAIIRQYQSSSSDVWPTMLIVAFYPAINRLWKRIRTDHHEREDLHELVLDAFLSGARALRRIGDVVYIPVRLRRAMEARAFREVKDAIAERALTHDLVTEALDRGRVEPFAGGREEETPHPLDDELLELEAMGAGLGSRVDAALSVLDEKEPSLRRLTRALRPDLPPDEQERLYQRLKRRYARKRERGVDARTLPPWWRSITDPKEDERRRGR